MNVYKQDNKHIITTKYSEAEKFIKVGWTLKSVTPVTLKGINKQYDECKLVWEQPGQPNIPDLVVPTPGI